MLKQLQAYLQPYSPMPDASVLELARDLVHEAREDVLSFLASINQKIYANCDYITRETGQPWPAGLTWKKKQGSCRDFAVLFMDICRAAGLATRFISGYQEGDLDLDDGDLHAWVEVYLPGAGWRGYDPTHGLAVCDRHIAVAASALPKYTAPVSGAVNPASGLRGDRQLLSSTLHTQISISRV
ncbi:transglutaminase family protein [Synechococcus sp. PCC 7336]|uniref:transglutaminase-like domain-containing protein n=1 Tax=Synechococcus sp. PCC 7336 TaxID=195250 RepID=UPI001D0D7C6E|nr:transglutaminase family protein [Synechococcus sp. PCC 7336]